MHANSGFEPSDILRAAIKLNGQGVSPVPVVSEPNTAPLCCIENVLAKVERDGGEAVYGWYFLLRCVPKFGRYVVAVHHAVWLGRDKRLADITPLHPDERHRPVQVDGATLVAVDPKAAPTTTKEGVFAPLANKYFAVDNSAGMRSYLRKLASEEKKSLRGVVADAVRTVTR